MLPVSVRVTLRLTPTARSPAWVSFDGRQRQPLESGDELVISIACVPSPPSFVLIGHAASLAPY